jgi:acyl dehydratase
VFVGQRLSTTTTVLGLCDSAPKGDQFRGKVWLGITTTSDDGPVVEYERCALVRGRGPGQPGHADAIPGPSDPTPLGELAGAMPGWRLDHLGATTWPDGETKVDPLRDHVDLAAPLARLTFNQAAVHRDVTTTANGRRLVYGGHVQGLAQASLTRMVPGLAHVLAWDGCDHLGPAFEGDLIEFHHTPVERAPIDGGAIVRFEVAGVKVADGVDGPCDPVQILRWTPIVAASLT